MSSHTYSRNLRLKQLTILVSLAFPLLANAQEAGSQDTTLPVIQVQSATLGENTEGTGSYTTGKTRGSTPLSLSPRDTPQSVTVVTQQRMEDQGMLTITDAINATTGVSVNQYETHRAGFNARGFDINNLQIDGVPMTYSQAWSSGEVLSSLAPYERVEVVRGATGLMTGAGDPSASINLVRKRATSKEFTGSAEASVGSWNQHRGMVDLSTRLNESGSVRGRVVGEYKEGDSWVSKQKNKGQTLFATIEADLTPNTLLTAGYSRQETNTKSPMWGGLPYWFSDGSLTNWDRSKTTSADWSKWDTTFETYFARLDHQLANGWKLSASFNRGIRDADSFLLYMFGYPNRTTGLGLSAGGGSYITHTEQDDIALQASGPFELAGRTHEAAFGLVYQRQDFRSDTRGYIPVTIGNFYNWNGSVAAPAWTAPTYYQNDTTKQDAAYGVACFNIADPLKVIIGARVTNYEKTGNAASRTTPYEPIKVDHEVTPYAGIIYDLNNNYSLYASYTDIFQPQSVADITGRYLEPIVGKSAEAGIKGEFMGGRLNTSFAVFQIKQDGLGAYGGTIAGRDYYVPVSGAKSTGFEFDVAGEIAPGWNATAGYTQFESKDRFDADVKPQFPREVLRLFTTYRLPGDWNGLTVGGGVNWQSRIYTVVNGAPAGSGGIMEQKSYSLVNLMARYEFNKQLSAQLNLNNITDEKYFSGPNGQITYGAPRNATLTLKYRF